MASTCLADEIDKVVSYCMLENALKKLSFVLVASSGEHYENFRYKDSEFVKDSRESYFDVGSSRGDGDI